MRPELELIEKIEDFLNGRLSAADRSAFAKEIAADPELRKKVEMQLDIMKGIERTSIQQKVKLAGKSFHWKTKLFKWGLPVIAGAALIVTAALLLNTHEKAKVNNSYADNGLPTLNETGGTAWADADKKLPAQVFTIDASKDTVIESGSGIVFAISANSFLNASGNTVKGPIKLTVKEAMDAESILKGGLSTKSGDRLLETGGMFYIDARQADQILQIDPKRGITADIPAGDTIKPGMQLFKGKRNNDGSIDWIDPRPLSHDLVPVDIKSLNFYPSSYLPSLKQWGYDANNKAFTDSLYYSFASIFTAEPEQSKPFVMYENDTTAITPSKPVDGKSLFHSHCASCHAMGQDMTGPDLMGVKERWNWDIEGISLFIRNWSKAVARGYPQAIKVQEFSGSQMTVFERSMTEQEIRAVINYVDQWRPVTSDSMQQLPLCGINPARIKTIWNESFQNTFIATKEFERRLHLIHDLRDQGLLDLYINNIDKELYVVDSMASLYRPDHKSEFRAFVSERAGKVKVQANYELLKIYYQKKTQAYTEAIAKTNREFWQRQAQLDDEASMKQLKNQMDSVERVRKNFEKEFDLNLKDAYRQLGYKVPKQRTKGTASYIATVTTTGWNNVDRYVFEATESRENLSYTDPKTGKAATIKYESLSVNVAGYENFDQIFVYLLPNKLSSFMRMPGSSGAYTEKLNMLMKYDLLCVGYKGSEAYYFKSEELKTGILTVSLVPVTNEELSRRIQSIPNTIISRDLQKEKEFLLFNIEDQKRRNANRNQHELECRVGNLLFPACAAGWEGCYPF